MEGDNHSSYAHQDVIAYRCMDGYRLDDAADQDIATINCDAGRWTTIKNCTGT